MIPLTLVEVGKKTSIKKIMGNDGVRQHLAELGFFVGAEVRVVSEVSGNMILQIEQSRVALDKTIANRIMV